MDLIERATIVHYHRHRMASHGEGSVAALGWRHADSQRLRFEAIAAAAGFSNSQLLDVGCGTGDLKPFLDRRCGGLRYLGLDTVPEFIATARARHGQLPDTQFECADGLGAPLPPADHVVACGSLSYRSAQPDFLQASIAHLWAAARRTLVFNVLDAAHFPQHPLLVAHEVAAVLEHCRTLTPQLELLRGYAVDDATFVLRRPAA